MRTRTIFTLAAALFATALSLPTSAQTPTATAPKETPPAPGTPRNFTLPAIRQFSLPNGLQVRFVPYGEVPKATVRLVTHTGNADEGPNEVWLADLTSEMMQQGTTTRSAEDIAREAATMGGALDVTVGMNTTVIGTDVFSESAARAVALIADVVRNPRLPDSELARLKGDLARNLSIQHATPQALASEKFAAVLFPNHPYGRSYPTQSMIESYTLDQVRGFHAKNFGAARSFVYVVGRFDANAVEAAIRQSFGDWAAGSPRTPQNVSPVSKRAVYFIDRPGAVQSTLYIGLPASIDPTRSDYVSTVVMNALLGGSFGSRITSNIREQKGYTYSPTSTLSTRLGAASWAEIADVTTNVTGPAIKEIIGEIDRLRSEPPTAKELQGIQNYLAGTFVLRNSSRPGIASQLATMDLYGAGADYLSTYVQRIYATTPAEVQRLAQTYIDPSKLAIVVVGDRKVIYDQLKTYGEVIEQ
ncbi:MAG: insulinase family protein [Acidobacteria bacterium]|nr:insulinase family protein [Acidobacteriota bacterium]MBV9477744.1 insulinase family protein [Acidobacteriota bacterium]